MLGDGVGRNEYIDQKPGRLWEIKSGEWFEAGA
jgi:hypothetical protein